MPQTSYASVVIGSSLRPRRLAALAALAALAQSSCGGAVAASPELDAETPGVDAGELGRCADFAPGTETGRVMSRALDEISGVVTSRRHDDTLWAHNDSGGGARLFAIDVRGALRGEWVLEGAAARDWEDVAREPRADGRDRLWIGDVGDNAARDGSGTPRAFVEVLRFAEPEAIAAGPTTIAAEEIDTIVLRYPDRPHDCEAIAVDPASGDLYLFAKENVGPADVFVARGPIAAGEERVLERVASIDPGSSVTGADFAVAGDELVLRTYRSVLLWERGGAETLAETLARAGRALPRAPEPQGEAVAWSARGDAYFTISEGAGVPIWRFERRCE